MSKFTRGLSVVVAVLFFISIVPSLIVSIYSQYGDLIKPHVKVAAIKIKGAIADNEAYIKQLNKNFEDKEVKAILLEIDSEGGHAGSSSAIFNEINCLKKEYPKPLVVLVNDICASAGYHLACTADYIITSRSALVGSIGSFVQFFNISDLLKKYDINYVVKGAGAYKTVANPFAPSNQECEQLLQELANNSYTQFSTDVAMCRKLSLKELHVWGNGKVFTGEQALKLGLIDECGSRYNAIQKIRELALIKPDEKIVWVKEKTPNMLTKLLENKANVSIESINMLAETVLAKLQTGFISSH